MLKNWGGNALPASLIIIMGKGYGASWKEDHSEYGYEDYEEEEKVQKTLDEYNKK